MERPSDADLMNRVQRGDRAAFAEVIERHKDGVLNYLTRLCGCRARAEELAQETFLKLYLQRERYQERGKLGALLYRIATNLARSEHRRVRRRRFLGLRLFDGGNGTRSEGTTPESELLQHEAHRQLGRALAKLKLRFRVPLVLHEIEGLTYQEVALVTGCRENTVKSRISRGRRLLRQRLNHTNGERR